MYSFQHSRSSQSTEHSPDSNYPGGPLSPHVVDRDLENDKYPAFFSGTASKQLMAMPNSSSASLTHSHSTPTDRTAYVLPPISLPRQRPLKYSSPPTTSIYGHETQGSAKQRLEDDKAELLAKLTSAQAQIEHLNEVIRVSAVENGKLVKDRQRLKARIDVFEIQFDELHKEFELSQQHTAAKDLQYSHIVDLSTKLQTKGVCDARQQRSERIEWLRDKHNMQELITTLRSEIEKLRGIIGNMYSEGGPKRAKEQDKTEEFATTTTQPHGRADLEAEITALKIANGNMKDTLTGLRKEHVRYGECVGKLSNVGKDMEAYLEMIEDRD